MPTAAQPSTTTRTLGALIGTQTLSTIGSTTTGLALALWLYGETGSVTRLGALFVATVLPGIVLGPYAGAVVDRLPRRATMLGADTVAALATGLALLLVATDRLTTWHLVAIAAAGSLAAAFQEPAYGAVIAGDGDDEQLERLNGLVQLGPALGIVAGPALAGVLLATGGLRLVLVVDLATFLVAVTALLLLRFSDETEGAPARPARSRVADGWAVLRGDRGLLRVSLTATAVNLLMGLVNVLLVPLLLGLTGTASAGLAMTGLGIGLVAGSALVATIGRRGRGGRTVGLGIAAVGAAVVLAGSRPSVAVVAVAGLLLALPVPVVSATAQGMAQRIVPPELLGRVLALRRTIATAALPVAYLAAGPLTDGLLSPWMQPGGALAGSLGALIGTGPGRGAAAVFVIAGTGLAALGILLARDPQVRDLDDRIAARSPERDDVVELADAPVA